MFRPALFPSVLLLIAVTVPASQAQPRRAEFPGRLPIIDMHIHAEPLSEFGGGLISVCTGDQRLSFPGHDPRNPIATEKMFECARPIKSSATDEKVMTETFAEFGKYNIRHAVAAGPLELVS